MISNNQGELKIMGTPDVLIAEFYTLVKAFKKSMEAVTDTPQKARNLTLQLAEDAVDDTDYHYQNGGEAKVYKHAKDMYKELEIMGDKKHGRS